MCMCAHIKFLSDAHCTCNVVGLLLSLISLKSNVMDWCDQAFVGLQVYLSISHNLLSKVCIN